LGYFLDDSENFENLDFFWTYYWSFLGPWTLYFWLFLYQITSKNIRQYMGTSWKQYYFSISDNQKFRKFSKGKPTIFLNLFLDIYILYIFCIYFVYLKRTSPIWQSRGSASNQHLLGHEAIQIGHWCGNQQSCCTIFKCILMETLSFISKYMERTFDVPSKHIIHWTYPLTYL
jgi:hypothetical protein